MAPCLDDHDSVNDIRRVQPVLVEHVVRVAANDNLDRALREAGRQLDITDSMHHRGRILRATPKMAEHDDHVGLGAHGGQQVEQRGDGVGYLKFAGKKVLDLAGGCKPDNRDAQSVDMEHSIRTDAG